MKLNLKLVSLIGIPTIMLILVSYSFSHIPKQSVKNSIVQKKLPNHFCLTKGPETKIMVDSSMEMIGEGKYLWKDKTVFVYFLDDDGGIEDKIIKIASEWTPYSGIKFKKTPDPGESDIRITFRKDGWWSYIGSYALKIPKGQATLSLDSLYLYENESRLRNVILHEFGHALGLIHEHQHPGFEIPWIKPRLFTYFLENYGVDSNWVKKEVIDKYNTNTGIYCKPDPGSIMIYAIPPGVTENDKYVIDWPNDLSANDKTFIRKIYKGEKCN